MHLTPPDYAALVAAEVRAEMGRQRKTVAELAQVLDMARETAGLRLNGNRPFDVLELPRIAAWLGVPTSSFYPAEQVPA